MSFDEDVATFESRLHLSLQGLAQDGNSVLLEHHLRDLKSLLSWWLVSCGRDLSPRMMHRTLSDSNLYHGPIDPRLYDLMARACHSGDEQTVLVVIDGLSELARLSTARAQHRLANFIYEVMEYGFHVLESESKVSERVIKAYDKVLGLAFSDAGIDSSPPDTEIGLKASLASALRFCFQLTMAAMRYRNVYASRYFTERLFNDVGTRYRLDDPDDGEKDRDLIRQNFSYLAVVLIGISLHVKGMYFGDIDEAANSVFEVSKQYVTTVPELIQMWEHEGGLPGRDSRLDVFLGLSHWGKRSWTEDLRIGMSSSGMVDGNWKRRGLRAALLLAQPYRVGYRRKDGDSGEPPQGFWNTAEEQVELRKLAEHPWLGIDAERRDAQINRVMQSITERADNAKLADLRRILITPINADRRDRLKRDIADSCRSSNSWYQAIESLSISDQPASIIPRPVRYSIGVAREYFIDSQTWSNDFEKICGAKIGSLEAKSLIRASEMLAKPCRIITSLRSLAQAVAEVADSMMREGYFPNVIVIPDHLDVYDAMHEVGGIADQDFSDPFTVSVGRWKNLEIIKAPYLDFTSIMIYDTTKYFGKVQLDGEDTLVELKDPTDAGQENDAVRVAKAAVDRGVGGETPPAAHTIRVRVETTKLPNVGMLDLKAARKIELGGVDEMAYLVDDSNSKYHLPGCPSISPDSCRRTFWIRDTVELRACDVCKPPKTRGRRIPPYPRR